MNKEIKAYNNKLSSKEKMIYNILVDVIDRGLPEAENKIWHAHPVWFLEGNPVAGYSKLKAGIRLMFWSGKSFKEDKLTPTTGKFKDASILYTSVEQINKKRSGSMVKNESKNI